jgi:hypothetical protein
VAWFTAAALALFCLFDDGFFFDGAANAGLCFNCHASLVSVTTLLIANLDKH